jgi:hypothetical protein
MVLRMGVCGHVSALLNGSVAASPSKVNTGRTKGSGRLLQWRETGDSGQRRERRVGGPGRRRTLLILRLDLRNCRVANFRALPEMKASPGRTEAASVSAPSP